MHKAVELKQQYLAHAETWPAKRYSANEFSLTPSCAVVFPALAAALCHDVGHGPFSHTFESCFLPAVRGNHCW